MIRPLSKNEFEGAKRLVVMNLKKLVRENVGEMMQETTEMVVENAIKG